MGSRVHFGSSRRRPNRINHRKFTFSDISGFGTPRSTTRDSSGRNVIPDRRILNFTSPELLHDPTVSLKVRHIFVRGVYLILTSQFLFKFILLLFVKYIPEIRTFFNQYAIVVFSTFCFNYFIVAILLILCPDLRIHFPVNLILMSLITISLAMMMASMGVYTNQIGPLLYATGMATIMFLSIAVTTLQNKWDVTKCHMCGWVFMDILIITGASAGVLALVGEERSIPLVLIVAANILLFTLWLIYVARRMMASRTEDITTEEHIFAALAMYVHLLLLLMFFVELVKLCRNI